MVTENTYSTVNNYVRNWLEVPISGTLSNVYLTRRKFGRNIFPSSVKFTQCQTVLRRALKTSPNDNIKELWKSTANHTNVQYDTYNSTQEGVKSFHLGQEDKVKSRLTCRGSFFSNVSKFSLTQSFPLLQLNQDFPKTFSALQFVTSITLFHHA